MYRTAPLPLLCVLRCDGRAGRSCSVGARSIFLLVPVQSGDGRPCCCASPLWDTTPRLGAIVRTATSVGRPPPLYTSRCRCLTAGGGREKKSVLPPPLVGAPPSLLLVLPLPPLPSLPATRISLSSSSMYSKLASLNRPRVLLAWHPLYSLWTWTAAIQRRSPPPSRPSGGGVVPCGSGVSSSPSGGTATAGRGIGGTRTG
mmetsp:Transcript_30059/g.59466  ORF Transcript_30059/g.59466 Transcript_30059/m.59466 type:complete len:201 (-) Transcript_30059:1083-1685(-)